MAKLCSKARAKGEEKPILNAIRAYLLWPESAYQISHVKATYSLVPKESNVTFVPHISLIKPNTLTKCSPMTLSLP